MGLVIGRRRSLRKMAEKEERKVYERLGNITKIL